MITALRIVWPDDTPSPVFGGESLSPAMTLTEFYRICFMPAMAGKLRRAATIAQEEESLRLWAAYTGDPPVRDITSETTAAFVAALAARRIRGRAISVETIRKHIRTLQPILDRLGPPGRRLRNAAGLLDMPPLLVGPRPRKSLTIKTFSPEELRAIIMAADTALPSSATYPVPTSVWWRCAVLIAYNTALRLGSMLALRWDHFDDCRWAIVPPDATKTGQPLLVYANAECRHALQVLRDYGDEHVLPWRAAPHSLHNARQRVWNRVLSGNRRWGFHAIRRTTLNWAAAINPLIARLIAGHSCGDTLRDHYVDPRCIADLLDRLPPLLG